MAFWSVRFDTPHACADAVSDALLSAGALAVDLADANEGTAQEAPIFAEPGAEGGLWMECRVSALIPAEANIAEWLTRAFALIALPVPDFSVARVDDADWVRLSRDQFQPIRISQRLWIVPTWHDPPNPRALNIRLDPGAAFGTGSHPTTRLCLCWLDSLGQDLRGKTVLDYGCGSGVLAIAAMLLGAAQACGADIDAQAVEAARMNAVANGVDAHFITVDQPLYADADIVLANILATPLRVLAPVLAAATRQKGHVVLAGLLDEQAAELLEIYREWFDIGVWRSEEGWACLVGTRRC